MKVISVVLNTIVIAITLIGITLTVFYFYGITPTVVISGSMSPKIPTGSVSFIDTKYPYDKLKVNDIIVYKFQNNQVIHRVIKVTDEGLETKGDANNFSDHISTSRENYYGKCLFSVPELGYLSIQMQSPAGKIGFVIMIIVLFVSQYIVNEMVKKR